MRIPRIRFTVRRMMIAVAVVAAGFGYARFAIYHYSVWEPEWPNYCTLGMSMKDIEDEQRPQRIWKIASLAAPPTIVMIGLLIRYRAGSVAALVRSPDSELTAETHQLLRFHRGVERRDRTESE